MEILILLFSLLIPTTFAASPAAEVQPFNLEFGLGVGASQGTGGLAESLNGRAVFAAILGYHWPEWHVGITTRGSFSTASDTLIQTSTSTQRGSLSHRSIEYGVIVRRYFGEEWYGQLGSGLVYNEAIAADESITPRPSDYHNRMYLNGTWFQSAIGHEFKDSPWFVRFEHTYSWYYASKVVETQNGINLVIDDRTLNGQPHEHVFTFIVGLANIF